VPGRCDERGPVVDEEIKKELLNRIKERDYVPPKAESEYSEALLIEYKRRV
jgi:hypothetical protein